MTREIRRFRRAAPFLVAAILAGCGSDSGTVDPEDEDLAPTAQDASASGSKNAPIVVTLQGSDPEGEDLTFAITEGPANGSLVGPTQESASSASVVYTPDPDFSGEDEFSFTTSDGSNTSSTATAEILVIDNPPTDLGGGDPIMAEVTNGQGPVEITLLADDPDGDDLEFQISTPPSNGVLGPIMDAAPALAAAPPPPSDGPARVPVAATVEYTPNGGFFGTDSFSYTATDGTSTTEPIDVEITVHAVPLVVGTLVPLPGVVRDFTNQPLPQQDRFWTLYEGSGGVLFESRQNLENGCYGVTIFGPSLQVINEAYAAVGPGGCDHEPSLPPLAVNGPEVVQQGPDFIQFHFSDPFPPQFHFAGQFSRPGLTGFFFDPDVDPNPVPINPLSGDLDLLISPFHTFQFPTGSDAFPPITLPTPEPGTGCAPDAGTHCLNGDRFRVQVNWSQGQNSGTGQATEEGTDTGLFYLFDPQHVDLVVRVLNGCNLNGRFSVFASSLTDAEVEIRVTDTQSGSMRTYFNPQAQPFQPIQDTSAFATCP